jgi:hypothetical protein
LTLNNDREATEKVIKCVTYYFDPVFKSKPVSISHHPYLLSRIAYLPYVLGCEIVFKKWTRLNPVRIQHLLQFEEAGQINSSIVDKGEGQIKNIAEFAMSSELDEANQVREKLKKIAVTSF